MQRTLLLILFLIASTVHADNWPRFRGSDGTGVVPDNTNLPLSWSTTENVAWLADVPGWGWSCPIVWGDRVFLTTVVADEKNLTPSKGLYLGQGVRDPARGTHHWVVTCFDLNTGAEVWSHEAYTGEPKVPRHPKSSYAAETPTTDGERVYALFGDVGLYCYDMDGKPLWQKEIAPQKTLMDYGAAASPVVHDGQVFVVYDNFEESWVAAFDAKTGKENWRKMRKETHSWATPLIWQNDLRTELVIPGKNLNRSYSLTGNVLWEFDGRMSNLVIPSPMAAHGMCYIASGYVGDDHRPTFAIKPGGSGNIAPDGEFEDSEHIAWYQGKSSPYNPSQIVYGNYLYTLYDRGFLTCHDAKTGEEVYGKRRFTPTGSFTSSPWAYNGHLFFLSEDGLTYVVKAGPEFEIVGRNDLQEFCMACPSAVNDKLLIRTASKLYCLTKGAELDPAVVKKMQPRREAQAPADLWAAARTGNLKTITRLLDEGLSVNARQGGRGSTALNTAAVFGQTEAAKLLIDRGADVTIPNGDGNTALHIASFFANVDLVKTLLAKGAKPDVMNKEGRSPIEGASGDWSDSLEETYKRIGGQIGLELDLKQIKSARPVILKLLQESSKTSAQRVSTLPNDIADKTSCLNPEFLVSLPEDYDVGDKSPLLIFLHGRGERGDDNIDLVKKHGPPRLIEAGQKFPFVVVSPQCKKLSDDSGWWRTSDLNVLLDHVKQTYKIDEDRIYLTGLSMGGFASWAWIAAEPDTFAAVAPICGGGSPFDAHKISHLPIWVFHGAKDSVVPLRSSGNVVKALKENGSSVKFTIYPDANHDSWTETYNNPKLYDWLQSHTLTSVKKARRASTLPSGTAEDVKQQMLTAIDDGKVAGASHLVVHRNRTVYFEAAGVRDIENKQPFDSRTMLRVYSMTKPITSVAAMTLFEQGKFQLDDPVSKYIPAFAETKVLEQNGDELRLVPAKRPITVRDVFRHTTGYSYGGGKERTFYEAEGMRYRPPAGMLPPDITIEKAANALARIPANHHPGEKFTYGFSTDLLGRLIEVWSGESLGSYMKAAVFVPLEMNDTGFELSARQRRRFASCHTKVDGKLGIVDKAKTSPFPDGFEFQSGGGGLLSTIEDYSRFCRMMVNEGELGGKQVLKPETIELMFTDQVNGVAGDFKFGLGFAIREVDVGSGDSQRRVMQYHWGGYASTDFRLIPDEDAYQIFMRQHIPSDHGLAQRLFSVVQSALK